MDRELVAFLLPIRWNGFRQKELEKFRMSFFFLFFHFFYLRQSYMMQFHYILPPFIFWIRETSVHTAISPTIEILFFSMCFPHIELRELIDRAHCALLPSSFSAAKKKKSEGNNREIMMHQTCFSVLPFFFFLSSIEEKLEILLFSYFK
jgi:hypothetical protein